MKLTRTTNLEHFPMLRLGGTAVFLLVILAFAGCASSDESTPEWAGVKNEDEPAQLVDFDNTAEFKVRWKKNIGDSGSNLLQPAIVGNAVYAISIEGLLTRMDIKTGKKSWRLKTGITASGGVGGGEGLIVIGSNKGNVLAYNEDGKSLWKSKVSSEVLNVSRVNDGMVVVRSGDGRIAGLNAANGERVWVYERSTPALVVRSHAGVTIQRGILYAGFAGGRLAAIKINDGEVLWETSVSQPSGNTELERISDITGDPVVDDEQVCAIAFQGSLACYDISRGNPIWNRDLSSDKSMMLLRGYLYLSDAKSSVIEMDRSSGNTVWKNDQLFMRGISSPFVMEDFVIVGDRMGYLHALSRVDGHFVARIKLDGGSIKARMLPLDEGLLLQTSDGDVYSLSIK